MAYIYESTQDGVVNFTIPGEGKTVQLFKGSRVKVKNPLIGGYLRIMRFVKEVPDEPQVEEVKTEPTKQQAKVADKITKVEVKTDDVVTSVKEEEVIVDSQKKTPPRRNVSKKSTITT
jgi:hypothetical protein